MSTRTAVTAMIITLLLAGCGAGATTSPSSGTSPSPVASGSTTPTPTPSPAVTPSAPASVEPTATPSATPAPTPSSRPAPSPTPSAAPTTVVRAYFLLDDPSGGDPTIVPVLRTVPVEATTARPGLEALLSGPSAKESGATPRVRTMIPAGTQLRSFRVSNGTATVDVTGPFATKGTLFSLRARIAQMVFTATQQASIHGVNIRVDGQPTDFGGGRAEFRDLVLPSIFVDRPAWGAAYLSGSQISGLANVFEAQFSIALRDASGSVLAERSVKASCGSGCWGSWSTTLHYDVTKAQWGELRVWDISEADGPVIDLRTYPVWLRP